MSLYDVWDHAISEVRITLLSCAAVESLRPGHRGTWASQVVRTQESNFWLGGPELSCVTRSAMDTLK